MAIKQFTDLIAWQKSYELALTIYRETEHFPKYEQYGLTSQVRRAAVSVCSNIAEGFGRSGRKEKDYFYNMAAGSLSEVENQILVAKGIFYLTEELCTQLMDQCVQAHKVLAGLQKANRMKGHGAVLDSRI